MVGDSITCRCLNIIVFTSESDYSTDNPEPHCELGTVSCKRVYNGHTTKFPYLSAEKLSSCGNWKTTYCCYCHSAVFSLGLSDETKEIVYFSDNVLCSSDEQIKTKQSKNFNNDLGIVVDGDFSGKLNVGLSESSSNVLDLLTQLRKKVETRINEESELRIRNFLDEEQRFKEEQIEFLRSSISSLHKAYDAYFEKSPEKQLELEKAVKQRHFSVQSSNTSPRLSVDDSGDVELEFNDTFSDQSSGFDEDDSNYVPRSRLASLPHDEHIAKSHPIKMHSYMSHYLHNEQSPQNVNSLNCIM